MDHKKEGKIRELKNEEYHIKHFSDPYTPENRKRLQEIANELKILEAKLEEIAKEYEMNAEEDIKNILESRNQMK